MYEELNHFNIKSQRDNEPREWFVSNYSVQCQGNWYDPQVVTATNKVLLSNPNQTISSMSHKKFKRDLGTYAMYESCHVR